MKLTTLIENHTELKELPFLIVFRTLLVLKDNGLLNIEVDTDVDLQK